MPDLWKILFFDDVRTQKSGESSPSVLVRHRNRSGVVELVGREPFMFARVENGVTKFSTKRKNRINARILDQKQRSFQWGIFIFLAAEKLTC
jgi:hypothetical protein